MTEEQSESSAKNAAAVDVSFEMKTIAKGGAIGMSGSVIAGVLAIIVVPIVTRILGVANYGLYTLATELLVMLSLFLHFGFVSSIARYIAIYEGENKPEHSHGVIAGTGLITLSTAGILSCVLFFHPEWISISIYHKPMLTPLVRITLVAVPLYVLSQLFLQASVGKRIVIFTTFSDISVDPVKLAGIIVLCYFMHLGAIGAAITILLFTGVRFLISLAGIKRCFPHFKPAHIKYFRPKEIISFSFPLLLNNLASFGIYHISILLGAVWLTNYEIGVYGAASTLSSFAATGFNSIALIFAPTLADLFNRGERDKLKKLYETTTRWAYHICVFPLVILCFKSHSALSLFGPKFNLGSSALTILAAGIIVRVSCGYSGTFLNMAKWPWINMTNNLIMTFINVLLCFILVPRFGMQGLALATGTATAGASLLAVFQTWHLYKMHPFTWSACKPALPMLLASPALLIHFDPWWKDIIVSGSLFAVAYAALAYFIAVEPDDKIVFNAILQKLGIKRSQEL
jgi:O-antigen/teichoic acid export membrane protein